MDRRVAYYKRTHIAQAVAVTLLAGAPSFVPWLRYTLQGVSVLALLYSYYWLRKHLKEYELDEMERRYFKEPR